MKLMITTIPEPGDYQGPLPEGWNLGRHIELHWLSDDRHPDVTAEVIVEHVEHDHDGSIRLHLVAANNGECS